MKFRRIFKIFLPALISTTCNREDDLPFYINGTYETENTASVGPVRLFTTNGEIADTQFIRNFILRHTTAYGFPNHFVFNTTTNAVDPAVSLKIHFREDNTAIVERHPIYYAGPVGSHPAKVATVSASQLQITETDSTSAILFINFYCENLARNILSIIPDRNCVPIGGNQECKWKHSFYLRINEGQIKLPMILISTAHGNPTLPGNSCTYNANFDTWNTFNNGSFSSLQLTDTIVIQEKNVLLRKL